MRYFITNSGEPMTNQQRQEKYPSGKCPLCNAQDWITVYDPEENEHFIECQECQTAFPEDK